MEEQEKKGRREEERRGGSSWHPSLDSIPDWELFTLLSTQSLMLSFGNESLSGPPAFPSSKTLLSIDAHRPSRLETETEKKEIRWGNRKREENQWRKHKKKNNKKKTKARTWAGEGINLCCRWRSWEGKESRGGEWDWKRQMNDKRNHLRQESKEPEFQIVSSLNPQEKQGLTDGSSVQVLKFVCFTRLQTPSGRREDSLCTS